MIFGYNSKLSSRGIGTILDYGRELLEEVKKVRYTTEVSMHYDTSCGFQTSYLTLFPWSAEGKAFVLYRT
jgi:hypothetical protein